MSETRRNWKVVASAEAIDITGIDNTNALMLFRQRVERYRLAVVNVMTNIAIQLAGTCRDRGEMSQKPRSAGKAHAQKNR